MVEGGVGVLHLCDEPGDILLEEGVHTARGCGCVCDFDGMDGMESVHTWKGVSSVVFFSLPTVANHPHILKASAGPLPFRPCTYTRFVQRDKANPIDPFHTHRCRSCGVGRGSSCRDLKEVRCARISARGGTS